MKTLFVPALLTALLCGGCYSTREVVVTVEQGLPPDPEIRQVATVGGERFEFAKSQGRYGVVEDTLVTGMTDLHGPVRIPVSQIQQATVSELNVFGTVLGVAAAAAVTWLLLGEILGSSGSGTGVSAGSSGGGGG